MREPHAVASSLRRRDVLALAGAPAFTSAAAPAAPRFRFLQINDLHYGGPKSQTYVNANQRIDWLFARIRAKDLLPPIDFVILLGDMIHGGTLPAIQEEMPVFREKVETLGVPFFPVTGNHENVQQESDEAHEAAYRAAFGDRRSHYAVTHKGVEFLFLNNSGSASGRPKEIYAARARELDRMLGANPSLPKVLCCHIPLTCVRDEAVLRTSFGFRSYQAGEPELLEMVQARRSNVRAVLSGHLHLTGSTVRGRVRHVSICGTASYPHDIALYSVYADRIEAEVIRLPSNLLEVTTNIHGAARHKRDFTDASHLDYSTYLMGNPDERRWKIPL